MLIKLVLCLTNRSMNVYKTNTIWETLMQKTRLAHSQTDKFTNFTDEMFSFPTTSSCPQASVLNYHTITHKLSPPSHPPFRQWRKVGNSGLRANDCHLTPKSSSECAKTKVAHLRTVSTDEQTGSEEELWVWRSDNEPALDFAPNILNDCIYLALEVSVKT